VRRIPDLRNNQANVNKTINVALAQSGVMAIDRFARWAGQVTCKGPYLFYRGNVKTEKLIPLGELLCQSTEIKKIAHPHMVHQESTHRPDDRGGKAERDSTSHTPTECMTEFLDLCLVCQH